MKRAAYLLLILAVCLPLSFAGVVLSAGALCLDVLAMGLTGLSAWIAVKAGGE